MCQDENELIVSIEDVFLKISLISIEDFIFFKFFSFFIILQSRVIFNI